MCGLFRPGIEKGSKPARLIDQEPGLHAISNHHPFRPEAPSARRGPSGFLVSVLTHVLVICAVYIYMKETVRVTELIAKQRYTVRLINVEPPRLRTMRSGGSGSESSSISLATTQSPDPGGEAPSPLIRQVPRPVHAAQPLISAGSASESARQASAVATACDLVSRQSAGCDHHAASHTDSQYPNLDSVTGKPEQRDAHRGCEDHRNRVQSNRVGPLPPSTTAPLAVKHPSLPAQMPATASSAVGPATPARVISLSDMQLVHGTIALPALNEVGAANGVNDPTPDKALAGSNSNGTGKLNASGSGDNKNDRGHDGSTAGGGTQVASAGGGGQGASQDSGRSGTHGGNAAGNEGDGSGTDEAGAALVTELRRSMDGEFGAVVVGASIAEKYPETMQLWAGRLAYTVYLHMGLPEELDPAICSRSRRFQHEQQRDAAACSVKGYLMERPTLAPGDFDSDAVMVHGLLNTSGHFEGLAVVFPTDFSQAKFVLSTLQQWRFRPALQDGKIIAVEVLLIIPEED